MLAVLALLLTVTVPLSAGGDAESEGPSDPSSRETDPVEAFFAEDPRSARYAELRSDIESVFRRARNRDISVESLNTLLREAAAKRVSPVALTNALEAELQRLGAAQELLRSAGYQESAVPAGALRRISVYLRAGVAPEVMEELAAQGKPPSALLESLETLATVISTVELSREDAVSLGSALMNSALAPEGYGSVASAYVKGRVRGLSSGDVTDIVVRILNAGGGIIQIDREITSRRPS